MAFGVPMFVARWARYDWSLELRSLLRGGGKQKREFQPILRDLRELVGQMANEREDAPGQWTAERLKQTLNRHLHGEKIVFSQTASRTSINAPRPGRSKFSILPAASLRHLNL